MEEVLAEFVFLGQVLQHASFEFWWREIKVAVANENGARHAAVNCGEKANRAGTKMKRCCVALQVQIGDADTFSA